MIKKKVVDYLKLMRVNHYLKNFLIFLPLIFSKNLLNFNSFLTTVIGFIEFSLVCSIIYIINDINDKEKDKKHEKKKNRPIASGRVTVKEGITLICFLFVLFIIFILSFKSNLISLLLICVYFVINLGYSLGLKKIPLVDVCILVLGFVLRVLFGGTIINIHISNWLNLTIMAMAFYFALGKRRNEIIKTKNETRDVLKHYNKEFLDKNMYMCLSVAIVFYSLWTVDINVINMNNDNLIWTVPLVIIICMRYSMIIEGDNDGDPVEVVLHDYMLLILLILYSVLLIFILYLL